MQKKFKKMSDVRATSFCPVEILVKWRISAEWNSVRENHNARVTDYLSCHATLLQYTYTPIFVHFIRYAYSYAP